MYMCEGRASKYPRFSSLPYWYRRRCSETFASLVALWKRRIGGRAKGHRRRRRFPRHDSGSIVAIIRRAICLAALLIAGARDRRAGSRRGTIPRSEQLGLLVGRLETIGGRGPRLGLVLVASTLEGEVIGGPGLRGWCRLTLWRDSVVARADARRSWRREAIRMGHGGRERREWCDDKVEVSVLFLALRLCSFSLEKRPAEASLR
jgi:hypothetical protein